MSKKNRFHRNNCDSTLRATIKDAFGRTVSLFGKHAFEWSIVWESENKITITTFKKGDKARKAFNNIKSLSK